jgi:hypothetical protein
MPPSVFCRYAKGVQRRRGAHENHEDDQGLGSLPMNASSRLSPGLIFQRLSPFGYVPDSTEDLGKRTPECDRRVNLWRKM